MIQVTDRISIDEGEIALSFVRASGPGGQNVNKVSSAVQLRFNVWSSPSLSQAVKSRLAKLAGKRMNEAGELVLDARSQRSQVQNRQAAIDRLVELIREAAVPPKPRHKTRPTASSRARRLTGKKRRSDIKSLRRPVNGE